MKMNELTKPIVSGDLTSVYDLKIAYNNGDIIHCMNQTLVQVDKLLTSWQDQVGLFTIELDAGIWGCIDSAKIDTVVIVGDEGKTSPRRKRPLNS